MRVLHVGNIVNNGYNNVKFLRRKGIDADVLCCNYTHVMGQPEWEDATFDGDPDEFHPDWDALDLGGFTRPAWFFQHHLYPDPRRRTQWFRGQFYLERMLAHPSVLASVPEAYARCRRTAPPRPRFADVLRSAHVQRDFTEWFRGYDLVQAYATDVNYVWLFGRGVPYLAYEHGTMREIPFERSARGRLLTAAYRDARHVLITNPDVLPSARRLGLARIHFIPHPVDETKYRPVSTGLRKTLVDRQQTDLLIFAPARHDWAIKGNDRLIRAFAKILPVVAPRPTLILSEWGQEVARSKALIDELGIGDRVLWTRPLNKAKLVEFYNAADVVLDQFVIGTFGTATPEAMACGRPVVLFFDPAIHDWCYSDMPPVVSARTEEEIGRALQDLFADARLRASLGAASREWIVKHHGWELVADRQITLYRDVLQR